MQSLTGPQSDVGDILKQLKNNEINEVWTIILDSVFVIVAGEGKID